jgi:hypothetical protein
MVSRASSAIFSRLRSRRNRQAHPARAGLARPGNTRVGLTRGDTSWPEMGSRNCCTLGRPSPRSAMHSSGTYEGASNELTSASTPAPADVPPPAAGPPSPRSPALSRICVRPMHPAAGLFHDPRPSSRPEWSQPTPIQPSPRLQASRLTNPHSPRRNKPGPSLFRGERGGVQFFTPLRVQGEGTPRPGAPQHPPTTPLTASQTLYPPLPAPGADPERDSDCPLWLFVGSSPAAASRTVGGGVGEIAGFAGTRAISTLCCGCVIRRAGAPQCRAVQIAIDFRRAGDRAAPNGEQCPNGANPQQSCANTLAVVTYPWKQRLLGMMQP